MNKKPLSGALVNKFQRLFIQCILFFAVLASAVIAARAQIPEVALGLKWLKEQVQPDGDLKQADSIGTKHQRRAEVTQTLKLLAAVPSNLAAALAADAENNTEYLSRKVISLAGTDTPVDSYIALLTQRQNSDGGFGGAQGYASHALDTSWTILAFAASNMANSDTAARARAYLLTQIDDDGAVFGRSDADRVQGSALALLAMQTAADGASTTSVKALSSWLLRQQGADGGWQGDTYLSALALAAVSPVTADATVRTAGRSFLLARQSADGSWGADPFLTSVVLRAIAGQQALPQSGGGVVNGRVVDASTSQALDQVSVTLSGPASRTVVSNAQGDFVVNGLAPGSYRITYARSGYSGAIGSASVTPGQTVDVGTVGLTQLGTGAIVRGQVLSGATNTPIAGVTITVTGATQATAVSNAAGQYELAGIAPGPVTVSASMAGFQTSTGSATIVAGQTLSFSPSLYATAETAPATATYFGKVVNVTGAPLAGVGVELSDGASSVRASSAANGQFSLTLRPASYTATFTLAAHSNALQRFVATTGGSVNAGAVIMREQRSSSAVKGRVTDASGSAIAGATVQLVGFSSVATSAADGSYRLDNINELTLPLRASASGFSSQAVTLQVDRPSELLQDFTLAPQSAGNFKIGDISVAPARIGSATDVTLNTRISNAGSASGTAVVQLQVLDAQQQLVGSGIVYDGDGNLIGQIGLGAGQEQALRLIWNSAQNAPGTYSLRVRLIEAGSLTRATPQGVLLSERAASVEVTGLASFAGSITASPPVLQAGTNTPVKLSAVLQNSGNKPIDGQAFTLSVIDSANVVVHSEQSVVGAMAINELRMLRFADWSAKGGGNYRLELAAADPALGKLSGSLYVGNAVVATYTTNKLVVGAGTQAVKASLKITGQDVANGSISDPLAPLVKAAIQRSVTYNDREAARWTSNNQCFGCHIQAQALVGGETNRSFATFDAGQRGAIYNIIKSRQQTTGAFYDIYPQYPKTTSMWAMWALDAWSDKPAAAKTRANGADFLVSQQAADGRWPSDHYYDANHYISDVEHTALNLKSMTGVHTDLPQVPARVLTVYSPAALPQLPCTNCSAVTTDQAGNIYVSAYNESKVIQYKPDGSVGDSWSGLNGPRGLTVARTGGGMLVATVSGLYRLSAGGVKTQLNGIHLDTVTYAPDGKLYALAAEGTNTIYQVDESYALSIFLAVPQLPSPSQILFSPTGDMLFVSRVGRAVYRIKQDKTIDMVISGSVFDGQPLQLIAYDGGWMLGTSTGTFRIGENWQGERLLKDYLDKVDSTPVHSYTVLADGKLASVDYWTGKGLTVLAPKPFDVAGAQAKYALAIDKASAWLQGSDFTSSGSDTLSLAYHLIGLGEAARFYDRDAARRDALAAKMASAAATLRERQLADGSWGRFAHLAGDSFVTAHVGYALDYLNPSPSDPYIRKAVQWLLSRQQADGSWRSENELFYTNQAATSWVSIWLPVILTRLGGIDTDLTVTFPANVKMSNPDLAPTGTTANPDGSITALWKLAGVTSAQRSLNYDLSLVDMALGETRAVSSQAHLVFKNSFTDSMVNAPIDIPHVKASAFLDLGVTTDKTAYAHHTLVGLTAQANNSGAGLTAGRVKLAVYGPDKVLIANVGEEPFNGLAAGASATIRGTWDSAAFAAATGYYVEATLVDAQGRPAGTAQSTFAILGNAADSAVASATMSTDKALYQPSDTVQLIGRIVNPAANSAIDAASVVITVRDPAGKVVMTKTESLPQLPSGQSKDYRHSLPLSSATAGVYSVTLTYTAAGGVSLARASATFSVASSATNGAGLAGTIVAGDRQLAVGESLTFAASATNGGNTILTSLPLTIHIINAATQKIVAEMPDQQTLAVGARYDFARNWIGAGAAGDRFIVALSATVGGKSLTLAQDAFELMVAPIKLDIEQSVVAGNRVLVLLSCKYGERDTTSDGKPAACLTQRSETIDRALTTARVAHTIVTDEAAFRRAMRSGRYNTYWISGRQARLNDSLSSELREAAFSGDGVIIDSEHDQRNKTLDVISAIRWMGKLGQTDPPVSISGPVFAAQRLDTVGRALKFELIGSTQHAVFDGNQPNADGPALVGNKYGSGQAVLFAFDLPASLRAQPAWQGVLEASLRQVMPALPTSLAPGATVPVKIHVANQAQAVNLKIASTLPAAASFLDAYPAAASFDQSSGVLGWTAALAERQALDMFLSFQLSSNLEGAGLSTVVSTVRNGVATPYGTPLVLPFTVAGARQRSGDVLAALNALALTQQKDIKLRASLVTTLTGAMTHFELGTLVGYEAAITGLVLMVDQLPGLDPANTDPVRQGIDQILKEAQWRWSQLAVTATAQ